MSTMNEIDLQTEYANSIVESNSKLLNVNDGLLELKSYQMFIKNFINFNTEHSRIMVNHETGTGKTITALNAATEFIKLFKKSEVGSVVIIGFTKTSNIKLLGATEKLPIIKLNYN